MRCARIVMAVTPVLLAIGCKDGESSNLTGPGSLAPPTIPSIDQNDQNALSAFVHFAAPTADSVRAIISTFTGRASTLPFTQKKEEGRFLLLGLQPATKYRVVVEAWKGTEKAQSEERTFTTDALPNALRNSFLELIMGRKPSQGYVLVPMVTAKTSYLVIFDNTGRLVWYRDFGQVPIVEAKQQPNGHFTVFLGATRGWDPVPGEFQEVDRSGALVHTWKAPDGYYTDSHEIQLRVEDGQTVAYFFGYDLRNADSLPGRNPGDMIAGHQLFRVTADGQSRIMHNAWDEFSLSESFEPPQPSGDFDHPNSLWFDKDGNFIISYRVLGTVVKVDRNTGKVLWRLGGLKSDFTFVSDPEGGFSAQHDAQVLENGDILLFDNGWRHNPQHSRAVEYRLDEVAKTATLVWSYSPDPETFTAYTGSVQRTNDGRTFIGFANINTIVEVGTDGSTLAELRPMISSTESSGFYRAVVLSSLFVPRGP